MTGGSVRSGSFRMQGGWAGAPIRISGHVAIGPDDSDDHARGTVSDTDLFRDHHPLDAGIVRVDGDVSYPSERIPLNTQTTFDIIRH